MGERIGKICVGDREHIALAGLRIIEGRFGKGKWAQNGQGLAARGRQCPKLCQATIFSKPVVLTIGEGMF